MRVVKILSLIFLSVFLIIMALSDAAGFHPYVGHFVIGLFAIASGVLMLISIEEYLHTPEG